MFGDAPSRTALNPAVAVIYGTPDREDQGCGPAQPGGWHMQKAAWRDRHTLCRDRVLAVALIHPGNPKRGRHFRIEYEHDFYVLLWDDDWSRLHPYDDDQYWFSNTDPWGKYGEGFIHRFPFILPERSIVFEGLMVSKEQYENAREAFLAEDRRLFTFAEAPADE